MSAVLNMNMTCQEWQLSCSSHQLLFSPSTLPFTHICTHQGFFLKYTLLNKQADMKTRARTSSLQFSGWTVPEGEVVFWSVFAFCSGRFTRNSELFNWKVGSLTETCTVMPGKKRLWSQTFSNCTSILNYEVYITPRGGEECTTCDATRLKRPVYASVSSQEAGSVRPARVDLPSYRPFLQPISGRGERFLCQEAPHRKPLGRMCMVILQECTE